MSGKPDPGAFYLRHRDHIYRLCYAYMKRRADAEDCCEDVFVRALTRAPEFKDEDHERKWLTVVAGNICKNRLRRDKLLSVLSLDSVPEPEAPEEDGGVLAAVRSLPPKYKEVVLLHYYEGYTSEQISQMLRCPASTVRNRLKDARAMLKELLH